MKRAGIREARQGLSALIEQVQQGRDILITDRGKPVARLVPPKRATGKAFLSHADFRRSMPTLDPPLSWSLEDGRDDRL